MATIELFKQHQYIDHDLDDVIITQYLDGAEQAITNHLHKPFDSSNKAHIQAQLLLASTWYKFRENELTLNISTLPSGISFILDADMQVVI